MVKFGVALAGWVLGISVCWAVPGTSAPGAPEWSPVRRAPVSIGPEGNRLIVGFRTTAANAVVHTIKTRRRPDGIRVTQAATRPADAAALAARTHLMLASSRQITPSMHVLFLPKTLYGADLLNALARLRADPSVEFASLDGRRYPQGSTAVEPDDPLFSASSGASGQWYLLAPNPAADLGGGVTTQDLSATDAVDAWSITTGSTGIVIADIDTGVRFDHPDLLRAGFGGRLLPGYDFVAQDYSSTSGEPLGTYLAANDGDGWDPDPSDPGDWISATDEQNSAVFPSSCGSVPPTIASSWHGTRVTGVMGALTNNALGVAGMSWGPWMLPVRALGKCGGYDSDIIAAIEWAVGLAPAPLNSGDSSTATIPANPYPADIVNLSLGGSGDCTDSTASPYPTELPKITALGVLIVISAGNSNGPVALPGNCSATVPGVITVAGLRNVGTKVGYSSFGPEVGVSAPAGNCINTSGACLRSIDTTTNSGTTTPTTNTYTDQANPNLGTSFSAPIVAGIAALMASVNANLTPAQLVSRLQASATPFPPNTGNLAVCPSTEPDYLNNDPNDPNPIAEECACPATGQCGTGMVDAYQAVLAAEKPIGVIVPPGTVTAGAQFDASASVAACNVSSGQPLGIASYAWTAAGGVSISAGANAAIVTVNPGTGGTLTLVVTDSAGNSDTETVTLSATAVTSSTAPTAAGAAATACPKALTITPVAPTVTASFAPVSVGQNVLSTLTVTLSNANGFALTQSGFSLTLPSGLAIPSSSQASTSCTGAGLTSSYTTTTVSLSDANIPADGSCTVTIPVETAKAGTYTETIAVAALTTAPAGNSTAATSASLTVTPPPSKGGGALGWPELLAMAGLAAGGAARRRAGRAARTPR
jgi:serine protease